MRDYAAFVNALARDLQIDSAVPLTGDMTDREAAKLFLSKSALKKREDWDQEQLSVQAQAALDQFKMMNERIKDWVWEPTSEFDEMVVNEMKNLIWRLVEPGDPDQAFSFRTLVEEFGPGPGAVVAGSSENFYKKLFDSALSCTSEDLVRLYRAAVCERPYWAEAEIARYTKYGFQMVQGSNFFTVPKNSEIQRSCATEPSINMMFQKATGSFLERRLTSCLGISLDKQPDLNRTLAKLGSIDGSYGTIDLKAASDGMSTSLVEFLFPPSFYWWLRRIRSPFTKLPSGELLELNMISSMGNGFTFPLQTVIFAALVVSVYRVMGIKTRFNRREKSGKYSPGNWAVFGDDIIVEKQAYNYVCHMLIKLGFLVNVDKSYNTGSFRESCGEDWFRGVNIRGVYVRSLKTVPEVYSTINRLVRWSANHRVNLNSTLRLLLSWVRFLPVPAIAADHEGIKVPYDPSYVALPGKGRGEQAKARFARETHGRLYRAIQVVSNETPVPCDSDSAIRLGYSCFIETGWAVAVLGGYARTPSYAIDKGADDTIVGPLEESAEATQLGFVFTTDESLPKTHFGVQRRTMKIGRRLPAGVPIRWKVGLKVTSQWDYTSPPDRGVEPDRGKDWKVIANSLKILSENPGP